MGVSQSYGPPEFIDNLLCLDPRKILYRAIVANNPSIESIDWNNIVFKFNPSDDVNVSVVSLRPRDRSRYHKGTYFSFRKMDIHQFIHGKKEVKWQGDNYRWGKGYEGLVSGILENIIEPEYFNEKQFRIDHEGEETYSSINFQKREEVTYLPDHDLGINLKVLKRQKGSEEFVTVRLNRERLEEFDSEQSELFVEFTVGLNSPFMKGSTRVPITFF